MDERKTREMGKRKELEFYVTFEFVPIPPEQIEAWKAGIHLLLTLLMEEKYKNDNQDQEVSSRLPG